MRPDSVADQGIIVRSSAVGLAQHSHELWIRDGVFGARMWDGAEKLVVGETEVLLENWYQVVLTAEDNGFLRLFVNGLEEGSAAALNSMWAGGDRWLLGSEVPAGGVGFFDGIMDEVAFFAFAMSPEAILARYRSIAIPEPSGLSLLAMAGLMLSLASWRRRRQHNA